MKSVGHQSKSPGPPVSQTPSGATVVSSLSTLTISTDDNAVRVSEYTPDEYERTTYYNGIAGDDHPYLLYRSDFSTAVFPKPAGRHAHIPVKSLRGVHDTPLNGNGVWDTVLPKIGELVIAQKIRCSSIDPARFFTHGPQGEEEKGTLGPAVVWIGVWPGTTSSDTAHDLSQSILAILLESGVTGVVVEWREAVPQRLAGPPLLRHVSSENPTHYVRRFLTPLLGLPLATEGTEEEDAQGTLTLWFHENKDKNGNTTNNVFGVSNCHFLRKDTTVEYEHKCGAPRAHVRVCGMRRFQRGLDEITKAIGDHGIFANVYAQDIANLEEQENRDEEVEEDIRGKRLKLEGENRAIAALEALYDEFKKDWSDIKLQRNIGYLQYAANITVDNEGGTRYISDWGAFLAAEAKVKDQFEGNVVDLGSKYTPPELTALFHPLGGGLNSFKFPERRKLRIEGCATKADLATPAEYDKEGQRCLIVGKDGNTSDLTIGRYAGLESFTFNEVGQPSINLAIYNSEDKKSIPFSAKGDSGSLVWDGKARIVGQLHSGHNKGGLTSNHVTYCTPGWFLLSQIKKRFPHADFYRKTW